jgi:hypothetical protein
MPAKAGIQQNVNVRFGADAMPLRRHPMTGSSAFADDDN